MRNPTKQRLVDEFDALNVIANWRGNILLEKVIKRIERKGKS
ncbi:MAG: hypothetical protein ABIH85_00100 [Candidatus Omnitrophota bacterium]